VQHIVSEGIRRVTYIDSNDGNRSTPDTAKGSIAPGVVPMWPFDPPCRR